MARMYRLQDYDKAVKDLFEADAAAMREPGAALAGITAPLFSQIVKELKRGPSKPCRIVGETDFSDTRFKRKLEFRNLRFDANFIANVADFTGICFRECEFRGSLELRNCRIRGTFSLTGCRFVAKGKMRRTPRLFLGGSRIDGDLEVDEVKLDGPCWLASVVVGGDMRLGRLQVDAPPDAVSLSLDNTRVGGRIGLEPFGQPRPTSGRFAPGLRSTLPGSVSVYGATCHSFMIKAVDIGGACSLTGLQVTTSLESTDNGFGADLRMDHLDCGEVLSFEGCSVTGRLSLAGTTVAAQLRFDDGHFAEIDINGASIGSFWIGAEGAVTCSRLHVTSSRFSSYVKMIRLTARISDVGQETAGASAAPAIQKSTGVIDIEHCRFDSLVTLWPILGGAGIDGWQAKDLVTVERGFSFTDCDVGGELNLTRLDAGGGGRDDAGFVRLDRTRLRGALFISSPLAIAKRLQVPADARAAARAIVNAGGAMGFRARMRSLSLREFVASAVELSGLDLVKSGGNDAYAGTDGCLVGERMKVAGRFETYVTDQLPAICRVHARIAGAMRLRAAAIGEFHLDGDSFRERQGCSAWDRGVVLELANIGLLRVPRIKGTHGPDYNGFPVPLDLFGVTVGHWVFDEEIAVEVRAAAGDFLDFLDNDENLHREVYKSVAASLRDAGRDDDAEQILYAEEYRARWESRRPGAADRAAWPICERSWYFFGLGPAPRIKGRRGRPWLRLGRAFEPFDRFFLQYRRNTINLLYLILVLFGVSAVFVSSNASNFELSEPARLVLQNEGGQPVGLAAGFDYQEDGLNVGPHPHHWGVGNTLWMTARYHIPIVSMGIEDEYVASNDNRLRFRLPAGNPRPRDPGKDPGEILFSAEDWFAMMSFFNWIMWPLLLTFAIRRALRSD